VSATQGRPAPPERIQHPTDTTVNRIRETLARSLESISKIALLNGNLLEDVELTAGSENLVQHGLGRTVRGWWLCDLDTAAIVNRYDASDADLAVYLPLQTSATAIVSLWVF
jgi:hypothetical protein